MNYVDMKEVLSAHKGRRGSAVGSHQTPGTAREHRQGRTLKSWVKTGMPLLHRRAPSLSQPQPSAASATQVWRHNPSIVKRAGEVNSTASADTRGGGAPSRSPSQGDQPDGVRWAVCRGGTATMRRNMGHCEAVARPPLLWSARAFSGAPTLVGLRQARQKSAAGVAIPSKSSSVAGLTRVVPSSCSINQYACFKWCVLWLRIIVSSSRTVTSPP